MLLKVSTVILLASTSTLLLFFAIQNAQRVTAQDDSSLNSTSSANTSSIDVAKVPKTLTVDMPSKTTEIKLTLAAVVNTDKQLKQDVSNKTELFAINEWNPLLTFQFREGSKIGLINVEQALIGKIKSYDSYHDVLANTTSWKNIPLNEDVILRSKDRGIHFFMAEVQFTNGISGIYAGRLNIDPTVFQQQTKEISDPRLVPYSSTNDLRNDTNMALSQAVHKIICDTLKQYGFLVCDNFLKDTELTKTSAIPKQITNMTITNMTTLDSTSRLMPTNVTDSPVIATNISAPQIETTSSQSSFDILLGATKILLDNAVQGVKNNDTEKALANLDLVNKQLALINDTNNTTAIELAEVLVEDAVKDVQDNDTEKALLHLDLANKQLSPAQDSNVTDSGTISNLTSVSSSNITTSTTANLDNTTVSSNIPTNFTLTIPMWAYFSSENPHFVPNTIKVNKGDLVVIQSKDFGGLHGIMNGEGTLDPDRKKLFYTGTLYGGDSAVIKTDNLQPGKYFFFCNYHTPLGGFEAGTLIVTEDSQAPEIRQMIPNNVNITAVNKNLEEIMNRSASTSSGYDMNQTGMQNITIDGKKYSIMYQINGGKVNNITGNKEQEILLLDLNSTDYGMVRIELPRNVIDSRSSDNTTDEDFLVFADAQQTGSQEIGSNNQSRTLLVDFEKGVEQIEILGMQAIPTTTSMVAKNESLDTSLQPKPSIISPQFPAYKDFQDRFVINYPKDWKVEPAHNRFEDTAVVFSSPSSTSENLTTISVRIVPNLFSPNIDLGSVLNSMISNSIKWKVPSFALEEDVECKKYNFTGRQACSFIYTSESKTAFLQATTNVGDTEYTLTYSAPLDNFDTQIPIAERMIGSFNITRSN